MNARFSNSHHSLMDRAIRTTRYMPFKVGIKGIGSQAIEFGTLCRLSDEHRLAAAYRLYLQYLKNCRIANRQYYRDCARMNRQRFSK